MCFGGSNITNSAGQTISMGASGIGVDGIRGQILLSNWLTAGGVPKPVDPTIEYAKMTQMAGVLQTAARGSGTSGQYNPANGIPGAMTPVPVPTTPQANYGQSNPRGVGNAGPVFPGFPGSMSPFGGK